MICKHVSNDHSSRLFGLRGDSRRAMTSGEEEWTVQGHGRKGRGHTLSERVPNPNKTSSLSKHACETKTTTRDLLHRLLVTCCIEKEEALRVVRGRIKKRTTHNMKIDDYDNIC